MMAKRTEVSHSGGTHYHLETYIPQIKVTKVRIPSRSSRPSRYLRGHNHQTLMFLALIPLLLFTELIWHLGLIPPLLPLFQLHQRC